MSVTAAAALVDTTAKEVGGFVETRELVDLPTTNRNFTSYLTVLPGVVYGAVGGQPGGTVNYYFDGGSNNDGTRGGDQARIPIEAIQEFQLLVAQADAEYGSTGGVVNAVSKQGTNDFHGSVLSLIRNSALTREVVFHRASAIFRSRTRGGSVWRRDRRSDREEQGALLRHLRAVLPAADLDHQHSQPAPISTAR